MTRRDFIANGTLAVAGLSLSDAVFADRWGGDGPLRIGIIGTGNRGAGIAHLIRNLPDIDVVACNDIIPAQLEKGLAWAAAGARAYTDYRALLEDNDVEAVVIATPLSEHCRMAMDALDAGKHVYLEKTMTYDIPQALALEKKVSKHPELIFQVGYQNRYFPLYHRVKEIISTGWLGEVLHYECQYHRNSDWRNPVSDPRLERTINWRMYQEYSGGLMTELCSHQIDAVNWFTGAHPLEVTGLGGINYWKDGRETYDHVRTVFSYPDGVMVTASAILSNAFNGFSIRILGTKATIELQESTAFLYSETTVKAQGIVDGVTGATLHSWGQGEAVPVEYEDPDGVKRDPTSYALLDFADCIWNGKKPFSDVESGRDAAIAVHLANQAIATQRQQEWIL